MAEPTLKDYIVINDTTVVRFEDYFDDDNANGFGEFSGGALAAAREGRAQWVPEAEGKKLLEKIHGGVSARIVAEIDIENMMKSSTVAAFRRVADQLMEKGITDDEVEDILTRLYVAACNDFGC